MYSYRICGKDKALDDEHKWWSKFSNQELRQSCLSSSKKHDEAENQHIVLKCEKKGKDFQNI